MNADKQASEIESIHTEVYKHILKKGNRLKY